VIVSRRSHWPASEAENVVTAGHRPERSLPATTFLPKTVSVRTARHLLLDFLLGLPEETRQAAALLVSEVTTNVVHHAGTPFSLCADLTEQSLRVEVADGSPKQPIVKRPQTLETGGRGMALVSELADSWGSELLPNGGKMVWFELSLGEAEPFGE